MPTITTRGRQQIFFGSNDSEKEWRFKEKITAVLELELHGRDDIYVRSPANVRNTAGDLEELDAVFVEVDGPEEYFEFVQVRDRVGTQGRPWLQQILGQKDTVDISNAIAVSTSAFAGTVVGLAKDRNVKLRLLHPLNEETSFKWYPDQMQINISDTKLCHCIVAMDTTDGIKKYEVPTEKIDKQIVGIPLDDVSESIRLIAPWQWLNIDVFNNDNYKKEIEDAYKEIESDGEYHEMPSIKLEYKTSKPTRWIYDYNNENREHQAIVGAGFYVKCKKYHVVVFFDRKFSYIDAISGNEIAQIVLGEFKDKNMSHYAALIRHSCTEENYKVGSALFT